ncbi:MAG: PIG-L family deacetylase [Planctomycetota bacterium]
MAVPRYLDPPPPPQPLSGPPAPAGAVLVFAPHPDDETAGPGATLRLHALRGDAIKVIFLTAGLAAGEEGRLDPERYQRLREDEARRAGEVLGVAEMEFWGLPDGARAREEDLGMLVPRFAAALEAWQPRLAYVPRVEEIHRDHHVTALAAQAACRLVQAPPRLLAYEIWTAAPPRWVVDVTDVHADKVRAGRCYESQLRHTDLVRAFTGLNTYRAIFLPKGRLFGEAFDEYTHS